MFERYTESARRVIFFARYEASMFGSTAIESEHMLLGLVRESGPLIKSLSSPQTTETIRREVEKRCPVKEKISTSIDLPLSDEGKRALAYAAEEAERLRHSWIGPIHLLLGLLREEKCGAAVILMNLGLDTATVRRNAAFSERDRDRDMQSVKAAVPVFRVTNVANSIFWYQSVLGFTASPFGDRADPGFAILRREHTEIMLQKTSSKVGDSRSASKAGGGWDAYIRVHDAEAFREEVRTKLREVGPIVKTEYGCLEFAVTDPDGHVLVIGECS